MSDVNTNKIFFMVKYLLTAPDQFLMTASKKALRNKTPDGPS